MNSSTEDNPITQDDHIYYHVTDASSVDISQALPFARITDTFRSTLIGRIQLLLLETRTLLMDIHASDAWSSEAIHDLNFAVHHLDCMLTVIAQTKPASIPTHSEILAIGHTLLYTLTAPALVDFKVPPPLADTLTTARNNVDTTNDLLKAILLPRFRLNATYDTPCDLNQHPPRDLHQHLVSSTNTSLPRPTPHDLDQNLPTSTRSPSASVSKPLRLVNTPNQRHY